MSFIPIDRMWKQVEIAKAQSEAELFNRLMYFGEMLTKTAAAGLVAAIQEERDGHRYRQLYRLVRADSIGGWSQVIDETLKPPVSQHLLPEVREERNQLTQKCKPGTWQYDATALIHKCLLAVDSDPIPDDLPTKVSGSRWFSTFAEFRNNTRGHGAVPGSKYTQLCPDLESSIRMLAENYSLFQRPWAYLHLSLMDRYLVTKLNADLGVFKSVGSGRTSGISAGNGVYVDLGQPVHVELLESDAEAQDFFLPNGKFNDRSRRYQSLSYITGKKKSSDAGPYLNLPIELPGSQTEGQKLLDIQGDVFGNLPALPAARSRYVYRRREEERLYDLLVDERNWVITVVGRGGIGKTSLTLSVLHKVAEQGPFDYILWFSARDIDLLEEGPKPVQPDVLTGEEIATAFIKLLGSVEPIDTNDPLAYFSAALNRKHERGPILFVFDNFETMQNPVEVFNLINTRIRYPNKALITTRVRFREFNGDFKFDLSGMNYEETEELIDRTSTTHGIRSLLTGDYRQDLYDKSGGHPYVIKILLGEVAKSRELRKIPKLLERKEDILEALFEETYKRLSPVAKRVFLTLCNWRSIVPQLAVEAVLLQASEEWINVEDGIEELIQSSFIEPIEAEDERFLSVPLVATEFGRRKLAVTPDRVKIEADMQLLYAFGAAKRSDIRHGVGKRIENLFHSLADKPEEIEKYLPMLTFIARKYPPAWRHLIQLHYRSGTRASLIKAKEATRQYLELSRDIADQEWAWRELSRLCYRTHDYEGELHALIGLAKLPESSYSNIRYAVQRSLAVFKHYRDTYRVGSKREEKTEEKKMFAQQLIDVMEGRLEEAQPSDLGWLAWLYANKGERERGRKYVELGLDRDPSNYDLNNVASKLFSR